MAPNRQSCYRAPCTADPRRGRSRHGLRCLSRPGGRQSRREETARARTGRIRRQGSQRRRHGRIYLSDNEGKTFVVKAGREFELLGTNSLGERITASPAVSGNELFYRTDSHVYCISEK